MKSTEQHPPPQPQQPQQRRQQQPQQQQQERQLQPNPSSQQPSHPIDQYGFGYGPAPINPASSATNLNMRQQQQPVTGPGFPKQQQLQQRPSQQNPEPPSFGPAPSKYNSRPSFHDSGGNPAAHTYATTQAQEKFSPAYPNTANSYGHNMYGSYYQQGVRPPMQNRPPLNHPGTYSHSGPSNGNSPANGKNKSSGINVSNILTLAALASTAIYLLKQTSKTKNQHHPENHNSGNYGHPMSNNNNSGSGEFKDFFNGLNLGTVLNTIGPTVAAMLGNQLLNGGENGGHGHGHGFGGGGGFPGANAILGHLFGGNSNRDSAYGYGQGGHYDPPHATSYYSHPPPQPAPPGYGGMYDAPPYGGYGPEHDDYYNGYGNHGGATSFLSRIFARMFRRDNGGGYYSGSGVRSRDINHGPSDDSNSNGESSPHIVESGKVKGLSARDAQLYYNDCHYDRSSIDPKSSQALGAIAAVRALLVSQRPGEPPATAMSREEVVSRTIVQGLNIYQEFKSMYASNPNVKVASPVGICSEAMKTAWNIINEAAYQGKSSSAGSSSTIGHHRHHPHGRHNPTQTPAPNSPPPPYRSNYNIVNPII